MRASLGIAVLLGLSVGLCGIARADTTTAADRFDAATTLVSEARYEEAAKAFITLADEEPEARLAADALFSAAQLYEEKLGAPARALELYDRLVRDYPESRTALASSRRASGLRRDLGPSGNGAEPLVRFTEIVQRHTELGETASVELMEDLVRESPDWVGLPRALLWLGRAHEDAGRYEEAKRRFLEAAGAAPGTEHEFNGYRGAGRVAVAQGHFDEAGRLYRTMPLGDSASRKRDFEFAMQHLARERLRDRLYVASHAVLAAFFLAMMLSLRIAAGSWRGAGIGLLHPPTEVLFMLPIAVLLIAASYKGHPEIRPAVAIICFGGMGVAWLNGAGLVAARDRRVQSKPRRRLRPTLHITASVVAVCAICYLAIHRTRLIELVVATVRFGPDV